MSGAAILRDFITLVPEVDDRALEREGQRAGRRAATTLAGEFAAGIREGMAEGAREGTPEVEQQGEKAGASFGKRFGGAVKSHAGVALSAATGGGIGALFVKGMSDALDGQQLTAKLTAQLELTGPQSKTAGEVAGKLFAGGYGDSMGDVNDALKSVIQNMDGMKGASSSTLTDITGKTMTVAKAFDQDLGGTTRAVSQMLRTGLAKNATEALDIITVGFQNGADKSEDFLDTLNEYGTQFRKMGIDGTTATGLIQQGLKAGARDGDLVADTIKEFSIRAIDGSKSTVTAYKDLGLSADAMTKKIAAGGPAAKQGLGEVLTKLRQVKDPAKQAAIATQLFGTQAEDMGKALFALDPTKAAKGLGQVAGATDKANKAMNSTPKAKIDNFVRSLQGGLVNVLGTKVIPAMERFKTQFDKGEGAGGKFRDTLEKVRSAIEAVAKFVSAHPDLTKGLVVGAAGLLATKKSIEGVSSAFRSVKSGADTAKAGWDAGKTALSGLKSAASSTSGAVSQLKAGLSGAKPPNATAWSAAGNSMRNAGTAAKGYATSALASSRAALTSAASTARAGTASALAAAKTGIMTAATKTFTVAQRAMNLVMRMNPIGIVITALVALGTGLVVAYRKSETFRRIVDGAMRGVRNVFSAVVGWIKNTALPWFSNAMAKMHGAVSTAKTKIDVAIGRVRAIFRGISDWVAGSFSRSWSGVKRILMAPVDAGKAAISGIFGKDDHSGLRGTFSSAVRAVGKIWDKLKGIMAKPINGVIGIINDPFIKGFNKIGGMVGLKIPEIGKTSGKADGGLVSRAGGGPIPGPWKGPKADNVLGIGFDGVPTAWVNPREYVTNVASTEKMNRNFPGALDYINRYGSLPGFGGGGAIPKTGMSWQWQWDQVRRQFPDARMTSNYRPGARTHGFGNMSYHAIGRAIDIGGSPSTMAAVARWIQSNWLGQTHDLLYTPLWGSQGFYKGRWSKQPASTVADHRDHVHWGLEGNAEKGKSLWNKIVGGVSGFIFDKLKGPAFKLIDGAVGKFGGGDFTKKFLGGLAKKIIEKAISFGNDSGGGDGGGGSAQPAAAWRPQIEQALKLNGITPTEGLIRKWITQIGWESGGDPNIRQSSAVRDINARTGNWAQGLAQVIPTTFRAFHVPGTSKNILDPLANLAAAINYAKGRYGPAMSYIGSGKKHGYAGGGLTKRFSNLISNGGAAGGLIEQFSKLIDVSRIPVFDNGGTLAPGINVVHNKTGGPEPLVRPEQHGSRNVSVTVNGVKHDSAEELAREVTWTLRRFDYAGKYKGA